MYAEYATLDGRLLCGFVFIGFVVDIMIGWIWWIGGYHDNL